MLGDWRCVGFLYQGLFLILVCWFGDLLCQSKLDMEASQGTRIIIGRKILFAGCQDVLKIRTWHVLWDFRAIPGANGAVHDMGMYTTEAYKV